ncbi:MAG TPA: hypothetical protein VLG39_01030 [Nitrospirota bacterium]|nr:hypothetical protein [Nitrospirota bacterium]
MVLVLASCGGGGGGSSTPPPVPVITAMNGGLAGSGTAGSLFVIDGTGLGTLGAAAGGYSVDFKDATSGSVVASASVNYAAGDWTDAVIKGTVPNGLTTATTYKVTVTTAGGTSNAMDFLVVASVAFSPSTITWSASTSTLPVVMQGFPSVVSTIVSTTTTTSYIYVLGGNIATSATATNGKAANTDAVYMSRLDNTSGGLASAWTTTTSLPAKLGFSAAVFANKFNSFVDGNGHVYVMGGLDSQGTATTVVYHAVVNDDGGLGAWTETTALPQALSSHGAVIYRDHIYVAGGNGADGNPVKTVYSAKVKSDGTLEAWTTQPDLPEVRAYHQVVTVAGYLYVIGGDNAAADPLTKTAGSSADTIIYNKINLANGNLVNATWSLNATGTGKAREKFSAVVAGSDIVVTGGLYAGQLGSSESRYAQINSDGSVGAANGATGTNTIDSLSGFNPYNQSTAFFADASGKPHILILGGTDGVTGVSSAGVFMSTQ